MRLRWSSFLVGFLLALPLSAQPGGERVWIQTDTPAYKAGERIHFKAYVLDMDEKVSTAESRYLYVEMGQDDRMLGERVKVMERNGLYEGTMDIPEGTADGVYSLRAYTLRMGRAGFFSFQDIQVGRPRYLRAETADTMLSDSFESLPVPVRVQLTSRQDSVLLQLDMAGLREGEWADLSLSVFSGNYTPLPPAWQGTPQGTFPAAEESQTLSGTVTTTFRRKPVKDAKVGLISPQAGIMATTSTDENGAFSFDGLDFPEGTQYLVRTDEKHVLRILETEYPKFSSSGRLYHDEGWAAPLSEWADGAIELEAAEVSAKAVVDPPKGFSALADFSFGPHQIEEMSATCMHEILRRVPGVFIREAVVDGLWEERVYLRASVSIFADVPAAIAIDGIIMEDDFDLDSVIMPDVERVDVFRTGQSVIWGTKGGGGVISITTKGGNYTPQHVSEYQNQKKVLLLGYQRPVPYRPTGRSLYWNPSVRSSVLSVPIPAEGAVSAWLSGITSDGRIVTQFIPVR